MNLTDNLDFFCYCYLFLFDIVAVRGPKSCGACVCATGFRDFVKGFRDFVKGYLG